MVVLTFVGYFCVYICYVWLLVSLVILVCYKVCGL